MVKFGVKVRTRDSLPHTAFRKNCLRGYNPLGVNLYQKLAILAIWGLKAHIFKHTMLKLGVMLRTWDCLPHAKCCKNRLRGYTPLG